MRNVLCAVLILLLVAGMVILPASPVPLAAGKVDQAVAADVSSGLDLFYSVTVEQGKNTVHVGVDVQGPTANELKIGFYRVSTDIHYCISNLTVASDGTPLLTTYSSGNTWTTALGRGSSTTLHVAYDIAKLVLESNPFTPVGSDVANVLIADTGGMVIGNSFFLVPLELVVDRIRVKFDLPTGWQVVCPYDDCGAYFQVAQTTPDLVSNFVQRKGISLGMLRLYSEEKVGDCTVKFGVLEADQSWDTAIYLVSQADADFYVHQTAQAVHRFADLFGENPYHVMLMYTNFCCDVSSTRYYCGGNAGMFVGGCQYWSPERYDELVGHLLYEWYGFPNRSETLVSSDDLIAKGLGECYLGCKIAHDLTGDPTYMGKLYQYYLVYKRAVNTPYMLLKEVKDKYYRGAVLGLYLDSLIQEESHQAKSIYDVFAYLYARYKNSSHDVQITDLEDAVNAVTGTDNSVAFDKYIYGNQEIPVQGIVDPFRKAFDSFLRVVDSDAFGKEYHSSPVPFFVDMEMAIPLAFHIPFGLLCDNYYKDFAKYAFANYDVSALTKVDVETSLSKLTGHDCTGFFDRWKDSYGELTLDQMKDWLKSYMPFAPQGLAGAFHDTSASLSWDSVQQRYPGNYYWITGYGVYKGTSPGTETLLANVGAKTTSYTDTDVVAGQTYCYYVKSIEDQPFGDGQHMSSEPSVEVTVECKETTPPKRTVTTILHVGEAVFTTDGVPSTLDSPPIIKNGRTFLPIRAVIESLGGTVDWDGAERKATVVLGDSTVELWIGKSVALVNHVDTAIDSGSAQVVPEITNSRTMLPLRFVAESLGCDVQWDGVTKTITITHQG